MPELGLTPYDLACRRLFAAVVGAAGRGYDTNKMKLVLHPWHWAAIVTSRTASVETFVVDGTIEHSLHGIPVVIDSSLPEDAMILRSEVSA